MAEIRRPLRSGVAQGEDYEFGVVYDDVANELLGLYVWNHTPDFITVTFEPVEGRSFSREIPPGTDDTEVRFPVLQRVPAFVVKNLAVAPRSQPGVREDRLVFSMHRMVFDRQFAVPRGGSPTLASITETTFDSATTPAIAYPATVNADDLLVMAFGGMSDAEDNPTTSITGWTEEMDVNDGFHNLSVFVRDAVGNEDGTTVTVTVSTNVWGAAYVARFNAGTWGGSESTAVEATAANGSGTTADPDPPNHTPSTGSKDYGWLAFGHNDADSGATITAVTAAPSGYGSLDSYITDMGADTAEMVGYRTNEAASENPGTFTVTNSGNVFWHAGTISIQPAASPTYPGGTSLSAMSDAAMSDLEDEGEAIVKIANESVEIAESSLKFRALVRIQAETVEIAEAHQRLRALVRVQAETEEISEASQKHLGLLRQWNETIELSEAHQRHLGLVRLASETVETTEADLYYRGKLRVQDESVEVTEAHQRLLVLARIINETVETPEEVLRFRALVRIQGETVEVTEQDLRFLALVRLVGETIEISEAEIHIVSAGGVAILKIVNETVEISEANIRVVGLVRQQTETVEITETDQHHLSLVRQVNESIEITEAIQRHLSLLRQQNEEVQIAEQILHLLGLVRLHTEAAEITEAAQRHLGLVRVESETEEITETVVRLVYPVAFLYATDDGTIVDLINELDDPSPLWSSIDDDPASPNDSDWVNNALDLTGGDASAFFGITNMPSLFNFARGGLIVVRVQGQDVSGTLRLYARLYKSDESTPLSNEIETVAISTDGSFTNYSATFTGIDTGATKTDWDGAKVRLRWSVS